MTEFCFELRSHSPPIDTVSMHLSAIIKDWVPILAFVAGASSVIQATRTYRLSTRLEQARWTVRMYEKFYEQPDLKKTREALDCESNAESVKELVEGQSPTLTDYLNFFELLAILHNAKQMSRSNLEAMFGYYLDCIQKQASLMSYVRNSRENGFEQLDKYLRSRAAQRKR